MFRALIRTRSTAAVLGGRSVSAAFRGLATGSGDLTWATVDPDDMGAHVMCANLCAGKWSTESSVTKQVIDPMDGSVMYNYPDISTADETQAFVDHQLSCPKTGLFNPHKNPERYNPPPPADPSTSPTPLTAPCLSPTLPSSAW